MIFIPVEYWYSFSVVGIKDLYCTYACPLEHLFFFCTHLKQTTIFCCEWIRIEVKSRLVWSNLANIREDTNTADTGMTKLKWGWCINMCENVVRKIHEAWSSQSHLRLFSQFSCLSLQNIHSVTSAAPDSQFFLHWSAPLYPSHLKTWALFPPSCHVLFISFLIAFLSIYLYIMCLCVRGGVCILPCLSCMWHGLYICCLNLSSHQLTCAALLCYKHLHFKLVISIHDIILVLESNIM